MAIRCANPNLDPSGKGDHLHHFGIPNSECGFEAFSDVKLIFCGGSAHRMEKLAEKIYKELGSRLKAVPPVNLSRTDRFVLYKIGAVICVNHGMGNPSLSIMLNEILKLLYYARASDVTLVRCGTSGGIGVEPGTLVVSTQGVNEELIPAHVEIMVRFIDVPMAHPLSRYHTYTSIRFHSVVGTSVEHLFWYAWLFQQGDPYLAEEVLTRDQWNPERLQPWVESKIPQGKIALVIHANRLYGDILMYQLTLPGSPFLQGLKETIGHIPKREVLKFRVFSSSNERVMSLGVSHHDALAGYWQRNDFVDGFNLYGTTLGDVAHYWRFGVTPAYYHAGQGMDMIKTPLYDYIKIPKTVLLWGDSNGGLVSWIRQGAVLAISGGTYKDAVEVLAESGYRLSDFYYIIYAGGICDVQNTFLRENIQHLYPLRDILANEANKRPYNAVLFSAALDHPKLPEIRERARIHVSEVGRAFEGTKVKVVNWHQVRHPFTKSNGEMDMQYFEYRDQFHLSHVGFRAQWVIWSYYLKFLRKIPYKLCAAATTIQPPRKRCRRF